MNNPSPIIRVRGIRLFVLILGGIALFFGLWTLLNNFRGGYIPDWTPLQTALVTGVNAFGCATIIGEGIPTFWPKAEAGSHAKHFTRVGFIFAGLYALQYFGVRMAIESHVG